MCCVRAGSENWLKALGLVENWYPLEAAYVATLFTDQIDSKIKTLLTPYAKILLFTISISWNILSVI